MLKLKNIEREIAALIANPYPKNEVDEFKERARSQRRVVQLSWMRDYLKTNPSEDYLKKDCSRIQSRLFAIAEGYPAWLSQENPNIEVGKEPKEMRTRYDASMDVATLKRHLKNAQLILNG